MNVKKEISKQPKKKQTVDMRSFFYSEEPIAKTKVDGDASSATDAPPDSLKHAEFDLQKWTPVTLLWNGQPFVVELPPDLVVSCDRPFDEEACVDSRTRALSSRAVRRLTLVGYEKTIIVWIYCLMHKPHVPDRLTTEIMDCCLFQDGGHLIVDGQEYNVHYSITTTEEYLKARINDRRWLLSDPSAIAVNLVHASAVAPSVPAALTPEPGGLATSGAPVLTPPPVIQDPESDSGMLSTEAAAAYANVSVKTILSWCNKNKQDGTPMLPGAILCVGKRRIPRRDLDPWVKPKRKR